MFIEEGERGRSAGRRYFAPPVCKGNAFFKENFSNPLTFLVKSAIIYEKSTFCWEKEMRAFDYVALKNQKWDSEIVAYIRSHS